MKRFYSFCKVCRRFAIEEFATFPICSRCLNLEKVSRGRVCLVCGYHAPQGSNVRVCPYHGVPLRDIQSEGRKHCGNL